MPRLFPTGKLPAELLTRLLAGAPSGDGRVILGPGIGQDAAVIDFVSGPMGERYLVAKTDPVTFASDDIGWYAVNVNANDIACMGAHPRWFLASVLLPQGQTGAALAETIFAQIAEACVALQVALVGGHTEITYALERPIVVGAMLGEVSKDKLVTSRGARAGDVVLLTKEIPLEGTALLAREKAAQLRARGCTEDFLTRARQLLRTPGISVVREALLAADAQLATAMHDPTEGGLATGLWELARAAQLGLQIDQEAIPISHAGREACTALALDPLGVMASGSLLLTTRAEDAPRLIRLLAEAGIRCTPIGRVVPRQEGLTLWHAGQSSPMPQFEVDELARLFA